MTLTQARQLAIEKMNQYGIIAQGWKFEFNTRTGSFGVCDYRRKVISLSARLMPACNDASVLNTIIHEIAHALTPGHHHDYVWRNKFIQMGGTGERTGGDNNYVSMEAKQAALENCKKYKLTCPVCGYTAYMSRAPKNRRGCGKHGGFFQEKYAMVVSQNY